MKYNLYTKLAPENTSQGRGPSQELSLSSEDHARLIQQTYGAHFETRDSLLQWYLSENGPVLATFSFLSDWCIQKHVKRVLSLGAGACVGEYMLQSALGTDSIVYATDFDPFLIEKARMHFPLVHAMVFDFSKEDVQRLVRQTGTAFELAVFLGSSYTLDDAAFVRVFRSLRESGILTVLDFQSGFIPHWWQGLWDAGRLAVSRWIRRPPAYSIFKKIKPSLPPLGKLHGYARTRGELRALYHEAGYKVADERAAGSYAYIALCEARNV